MNVHVLKYFLRQLDVPWNTWLIRRCCAFMKSGYFPSAFNKNQHWSLTHRLKTAFAGYRGWDFSDGTGWNCSQIGNRTLETEKGRERDWGPGSWGARPGPQTEESLTRGERGCETASAPHQLFPTCCEALKQLLLWAVGLSC